MLKVGDWVASSNPTKPDDTYIDILVDGLQHPVGKYPALEKVKPEWIQGDKLIIPDVSARYFRQANSDRYTQDTILEDAIRNITGAFGIDDENMVDTNLFYRMGRDNGPANVGSGKLVGFDASRVVPTAEENRPKTFVVKYYLKAVDADFAAIDYMYPIGAIYMSVSPVSPAELFRYGKWEEITGKVPIGVDPTDTEMSAAGMTGGSKETILTVDQLPAHDHDVTVPTMQWPEEQQKVQTAGYSAKHHTMVASKSGKTGKSHPINNLPPYFTVHMWQRIG